MLAHLSRGTAEPRHVFLAQALLERKRGTKGEAKGKGKFTEAEVQAMAEVD